jgi:hypothetical protein
MTIEYRRSYLNRIRLRYQNSTKKERGKILDEFRAVCGYTRKYAIRICRGQIQPRTKKPGRRAKYSSGRFLFYFTELWEQIMSTRNCQNKKLLTSSYFCACSDL